MISQKEKAFEIEKSRTFDLERTKEIKFYLYLLIAFCIVVSFLFVMKLFKNDVKNPFVAILISILIATTFTLSINKL